MTKCVFGNFRPGQTQTGLRSHRSYTANENRNEIDIRSTFTIQSYVRIDRFGVDYQSVIDQSNQFIHCRSFNRLNHSYCFIDPFIPQKYEIEKRTKFTKVHKVFEAFSLFIYSIYLFNKCHNFIFFNSPDWYVLWGIKFYFSCKTITQKQNVA